MATEATAATAATTAVTTVSRSTVLYIVHDAGDNGDNSCNGGENKSDFYFWDRKCAYMHLLKLNIQYPAPYGRMPRGVLYEMSEAGLSGRLQQKKQDSTTLNVKKLMQLLETMSVDDLANTCVDTSMSTGPGFSR